MFFLFSQSFGRGVLIETEALVAVPVFEKPSFFPEERSLFGDRGFLRWSAEKIRIPGRKGWKLPLDQNQLPNRVTCQFLHGHLVRRFATRLEARLDRPLDDPLLHVFPVTCSLAFAFFARMFVLKGSFWPKKTKTSVELLNLRLPTSMPYLPVMLGSDEFGRGVNLN